MKAIVLTEYGGLDKLKLEERPDPEPAAGQVQVRVRSASINPIDWKLRSGAAKARMPLELPAILGRDAAGEVSHVGPGVTELKVGDAVMGLVMGAYAELVVAPLESWAKLPPGLSVNDAGALPLALLTGDQLAEATLAGPKAKPGETVLVTGAAGSVGRAAVWGLKSRGARVLAGVRGKQVDEAKKLGADDVVAIDDDAAIARLPPLDAIADTVSGETIRKLLAKVKPGGRIGSVLGETPGAKERGLTVHAFMAHPDRKRLAELGEAVARGELTIPIEKRFPLPEARAAQELAEKGGVAKVLLMA
jgi:NADPH:quinone reductase-like Zn-dependent oxidoreductase